MSEQIVLIPTGPRDVAVRSQQNGRSIELVAGVDDEIDPVGPARPAARSPVHGTTG